MDDLRKRVLALGALVEKNLRLAQSALQRRDPDLARDIVNADEEIDRAEIDVEEECLKILALYQPVAADLRMIVSILKINNDLERIGDQAVNIAHKIERLLALPQLPVDFDFIAMSDQVRKMLKDALDAVVTSNSDLARSVCASDDNVDRMKSAVRTKVVENLRAPDPPVESLNDVLGLPRNRERVADLATNVAEDAIYMIEGDIIRHNIETGE
jgi:phosphate transport system protein